MTHPAIQKYEAAAREALALPLERYYDEDGQELNFKEDSQILEDDMVAALTAAAVTLARELVAEALKQREDDAKS